MHSFTTGADHMQIEVISVIPHERELNFSSLCSFSVQSLFQILLGLVIGLDRFDFGVALIIDLKLSLCLHCQHLFLTQSFLFKRCLMFLLLKFQEAFFLFLSLPFHALLESFQLSLFSCFLGFVFLLLHLAFQFIMSDGILHLFLMPSLHLQFFFFGSEPLF